MAAGMNTAAAVAAAAAWDERKGLLFDQDTKSPLAAAGLISIIGRQGVGKTLATCQAFGDEAYYIYSHKDNGRSYAAWRKAFVAEAKKRAADTKRTVEVPKYPPFERMMRVLLPDRLPPDDPTKIYPVLQFLIDLRNRLWHESRNPKGPRIKGIVIDELTELLQRLEEDCTRFEQHKRTDGKRDPFAGMRRLSSTLSWFIDEVTRAGFYLVGVFHESDLKFYETDEEVPAAQRGQLKSRAGPMVPNRSVAHTIMARSSFVFHLCSETVFRDGKPVQQRYILTRGTETNDRKERDCRLPDRIDLPSDGSVNFRTILESIDMVEPLPFAPVRFEPPAASAASGLAAPAQAPAITLPTPALAPVQAAPLAPPELPAAVAAEAVSLESVQAMLDSQPPAAMQA